MAVKLADIPAIVNMIERNSKVGELRLTISFRIIQHYRRGGQTTSIPYNASGSILLSILWGADKTAKQIALINDLDFGVVNQGEASHTLRHIKPLMLERMEVAELERWIQQQTYAKKERPSQKEIDAKKAWVKADFLVNFPYDVKDKFGFGGTLFPQLEVELTLEEALKLFNENKLKVLIYQETLDWAMKGHSRVLVEKAPYESWTFERDLIVDSNS